MTQAEMKKTIRAMGVTVSVKDGEIRINHVGGDEQTAYFTNDRQDAVDTARKMAEFQAEVSAARLARQLAERKQEQKPEVWVVVVESVCEGHNEFASVHVAGTAEQASAKAKQMAEQDRKEWMIEEESDECEVIPYNDGAFFAGNDDDGTLYTPTLLQD